MSAVATMKLQTLRREEAERRAMLDALAEEIRRWAAAPDDEFVEHAPGDFTRILGRLLADRDAPG